LLHIHGLHKFFQVIITDIAHMAECSICHFIQQIHLTNAPIKTRALQYIRSCIFLTQHPRVITFVDERQKASKPLHIEAQ